MSLGAGTQSILWTKIGSIVCHGKGSSRTLQSFIQHKLYQSFFFFAWLVLYQIGVYQWFCSLNQQRRRRRHLTHVPQHHALVSENVSCPLVSDEDDYYDNDLNDTPNSSDDNTQRKATVIDRYTIRRKLKTVPVKKIRSSSSSKHNRNKKEKKKTIVVYRREEIDLPAMLHEGEHNKTKRRKSKDYYTLLPRSRSGSSTTSSRTPTLLDHGKRTKDGAENQMNATNASLSAAPKAETEKFHSSTTANHSQEPRACSSPTNKDSSSCHSSKQEKESPRRVGKKELLKAAQASLQVCNETFRERISLSSSKRRRTKPQPQTWIQTLPSISEDI